MFPTQFILHQPVSVEETRHYEFKTIDGANPVDTIAKTADTYVVAFLNSEGGRIYWGIRNEDRVVVGLRLNLRQRDELRRVVTENLTKIQPAIAPTAFRVELHPVCDGAGVVVVDMFVVEVLVPRVFTNDLYFTGTNAAWVKTDGGKKRLTGSEITDEILRRRQGNTSDMSNASGWLSPITSTVTRGPDDLLAMYAASLESRVRYVKIFGDSAAQPLEKVFVKLTITDKYDQRYRDSQYLGLLDAELRQRRSVFGTVQKAYKKRDSSKSNPIPEQQGITPDDVLGDTTHVVITGAPGCGKTTLMRYLTGQTLRQWRKVSDTEGVVVDAQKPSRLPLFLELKQLSANSIAQAQGCLEDLLFDKALADIVKPRNDVEREMLNQRFRTLLSEGRIAIFLDGLDEVSGASFFTELQAMVSTFLQSAYGNNTFIISTRPFAVRQLGDMQLMEIASFTPSQIEQFITHYYDNSQEREEFKQELQRRRELCELARVPALLGFILHLWRRHGLVNSDKLSLYDAVSRELAQQLDSEKEGVPPERRWLIDDPNGSLKHDFMRLLAFDLLFQGVVDLNEEAADLDRLAFSSETLLKTARRFATRIKQHEGQSLNPRHIAEDAKATALIRQVGADMYVFTHLTLQEYLAAVELAGQGECERIFCRAYFNQTLVAMEVLPMTLGIVHNPDHLYQAIRQLPDSLNYTSLQLLTSGLEYGARISADVLRELTLEMAKFVCQANIDFDSSEFVRSFAWLRTQPAYYETIAPLLGHEEDAVRSRVAALLGIIGEQRAIDLLVRCIEQDPRNRESYARALHKLGEFKKEDVDRQKVASLIALIKQSPIDDDVKELLVKDLITHGMTKDLMQAIKNYCLEGMGLISAEILKVQELMYEEGDDFSISSIMFTSQNERGASEPVRLRASAFLQKLSNEQILELLHKEVESGKSSRQKAMAIGMLWQVGDLRSVGILLGVLHDGSNSLRWEAIGALAQMNPKVVKEGLLHALSHKDDGVRKKAAEIVGYYTTTRVEESLVHLATCDPNEEVRETAQEALKKFERKLYYSDGPV